MNRSLSPKRNASFHIPTEVTRSALSLFAVATITDEGCLTHAAHSRNSCTMYFATAASLVDYGPSARRPRLEIDGLGSTDPARSRPYGYQKDPPSAAHAAVSISCLNLLHPYSVGSHRRACPQCLQCLRIIQCFLFLSSSKVYKSSADMPDLINGDRPQLYPPHARAIRVQETRNKSRKPQSASFHSITLHSNPLHTLLFPTSWVCETLEPRCWVRMHDRDNVGRKTLRHYPVPGRRAAFIQTALFSRARALDWQWEGHDIPNKATRISGLVTWCRLPGAYDVDGSISVPDVGRLIGTAQDIERHGSPCFAP